MSKVATVHMGKALLLGATLHTSKALLLGATQHKYEYEHDNTARSTQI